MEGGGWQVGHSSALSVSHDRSGRIREPPSLPVTDNVVQQYDDSKNAHWSWRSMPPTVSEPLRPQTSSTPSRVGPKVQASASGRVSSQLPPFTLTTTLWEDEGAMCFQVEARGVCVSRREDNHMINGTKLLNVAGLTRGRRDGILKSERTRQVVKIGPTHVKGVWIPLHRALEFADKEKITELLYPLFEHNIGALLYHPLNQPSSHPDAIASQSLRYSYATTKDESSDKIEAIEHKNKIGAAEGFSYSPWLNKARNHDVQERQEHSQDQPLVAGPDGADDKMQNRGRGSAARIFDENNDSERRQRHLSEPRALDISNTLGMHRECGRPTRRASADARLGYSVHSQIDQRDEDAAPRTQATSAAELYDIIRDLQTRVSRLFEKTGIAPWNSSGGEPSGSDSKDGNSMAFSSSFPDYPTGSSEHSEEWRVHCGTRLQRSRSVDRSRTRLGDLHMRVVTRSQSQPPPISRRAVNSSHQDDTHVECAPNGRPSLYSFTHSTDRKRGRGESIEGRIGGGQEEEKPQGSRAKRVRQCHPSDERERFPCIFHVGEPGRYPKDTATYEFISQLLRHLRSHDFYTCSKCFTKFDDLAAQELHENNPCRKSCPRRRCKRYVPFNASPLSTCECIMTATQQWYELFRLEYPGRPFQGLLDRVLPPEREAGSANPLPLFEQVYTFEMLPEDFNMSQSGLSAAVSGEEGAGIAAEELNSVYVPLASPLVVDPSFFSEIQTLRERVRHLEQRIAQPTEREQDLEMVLANVWQALARSSSAEGQPRSAVWRLVQRFASNVLSDTPAPSESMILGNTSTPVVTTDAGTGWQDLWNDAGPMVESSKATGMDSAYGSTR